jgi:hypothetical protein
MIEFSAMEKQRTKKRIVFIVKSAQDKKCMICDLSDKNSINHDVISIHRDDYGHGSTVNSSNMN